MRMDIFEYHFSPRILHFFWQIWDKKQPSTLNTPYLSAYPIIWPGNLPFAVFTYNNGNPSALMKKWCWYITMLSATLCIFLRQISVGFLTSSWNSGVRSIERDRHVRRPHTGGLISPSECRQIEQHECKMLYHHHHYHYFSIPWHFFANF